MTTWKYIASRVRDQASDEEYWEIRELYLEDDGRFSYTEDAVAPGGNTLEELRHDLDMMQRDSQLRPYLDLTSSEPRLVQ